MESLGKGAFVSKTLDAIVVFGFVPFLGKVLDIRDLAACIYALNNDKDRTPTHQKWVALTLAIFGTIPGAGDVAKAALKIILLKIRKMGANNVGRAVQAALMPIRRLLRDEQLVKLVGSQRLQNVYHAMADWCRDKAKSLAVQDIINRWKVLQTASVVILPAAGIAGAVGMTCNLSILRPSQGFNATKCVGDFYR